MLHAEFSIAPLLLLAAFGIISSLSKRKRPPGPSTQLPTEPRTGFMSDLQKALEELQQVQREQSPLHRVPPPETPSWQIPSASVEPPKTPQEKAAADWLAKQKSRKALATRGSGKLRSVRVVAPLPVDADDPSSETVVSLEGRDYDDEAEKVILARRQAAEHRVQRVDESSESLSLLQQARRASRPDLAIGGLAEHAAWHGEIGKDEGQRGQKEQGGQRGPLSRYADGTARSAIILSEILQPPVGQRDS